MASYNLEGEVATIVWCMEILQNLTRDNVNKKLFRKLKRPNYVLLMEMYENKRERVMRITKLAGGKVWNIIIPSGRFRWGWRKLAGCLDNLVGKHFWYKNRFTLEDTNKMNTTSSIDFLIEDGRISIYLQPNLGFQNLSRISITILIDRQSHCKLFCQAKKVNRNRKLAVLAVRACVFDP